MSKSCNDSGVSRILPTSPQILNQNLCQSSLPLSPNIYSAPRSVYGSSVSEYGIQDFYTRDAIDDLINNINLSLQNFILRVPTESKENVINPGNNNTVALTLRGSSTNPVITRWFSSNGNQVAYIANNGLSVFANKVTIGGLVPNGFPALDVQSRRITGVADPSAASDAVPYSFLQSYVDGITPNVPITDIEANQGLTLTDTVLGTVYNTLVPDNTYSTPVGGAPATLASTWKTRNIVEVLDSILFPTTPIVQASVGSGKSVNLTVSGASGTLEIGSTMVGVLTATFGAGQILNGDGSSGPNLVGPATLYSFIGTGIFQTDQPGNTLSITNVVVSGTNNWAVTASHNAGTGAYYDSSLAPATNLDSLRISGTVSDSTSSPSITGVYPYFWGVSSVPVTAADVAALVAGGSGSSNKVVVSSANTLIVTFNASAQYLWFAHPASSTAKTKWYNTVINNGNIGSPSDLFGASATQPFSSAEGYWSGISYRVYVSNYATTTGGAMELRNN